MEQGQLDEDEHMSDVDPLFLWRLSDQLSVEDAAILIAGGDPSAVDSEIVVDSVDDFPHEIEVKRTTGHIGFVPAFTALKMAIRLGKLNARLEYNVQVNYVSARPIPCWVVSKVLLTDPSQFETYFGFDHSDSVLLAREPDWSRSMLEVHELEEWLRGRGINSGFFFPTSQADDEDFMDPTHEHFAVELAFAVSAWRALSRTQKFPKGTKMAIEDWIDNSISEWHGEKEMSVSARERIATVVNWNKNGGANPTSG